MIWKLIVEYVIVNIENMYIHIDLRIILLNKNYYRRD